MPRSRIEISGDLDTWIRELPSLGRGNEVRDEWADATHAHLLDARGRTHVITGQLRATSYSNTEQRGSRVTGELWWPATSPQGYHYAQAEWGLIPSRREHLGSDHDVPRWSFLASEDNYRRALIRGLEAQVSSWS